MPAERSTAAASHPHVQLDRFGENEKPANGKKSDSSALAQRALRLQEKVDALTSELSSAKEQLAAQQMKIGTLENEAGVRRRRLAGAQQEVRDGVMALEHAKAELAECTDAAAEKRTVVAAASTAELSDLREAIAAARGDVDAARSDADAARSEAAEWKKRAEAAQAHSASVEKDLERAHECVQTLRDARWKTQEARKQALAARAQRDFEADHEAALDAAHTEKARAERASSEASLLAKELECTEHALQHASAAAMALGTKAEELLRRLTQRTATAAQAATADLITAAVRSRSQPSLVPSLRPPPAVALHRSASSQQISQHAHMRGNIRARLERGRPS
jgi:chromosome segregation ATPase